LGETPQAQGFIHQQVSLDPNGRKRSLHDRVRPLQWVAVTVIDGRWISRHRKASYARAAARQACLIPRMRRLGFSRATQRWLMWRSGYVAWGADGEQVTLTFPHVHGQMFGRLPDHLLS
jgi:hypothetical protein